MVPGATPKSLGGAWLTRLGANTSRNEELDDELLEELERLRKASGAGPSSAPSRPARAGLVVGELHRSRRPRVGLLERLRGLEEQFKLLLVVLCLKAPRAR